MDASEPTTVKGRLPGVVLAALAAGLIAVTLFLPLWGKAGRRNRYAMADSLSAGLRSAKVCEDGECRTIQYTDALDSDAHKTFVTLGAMTFWLGLAAAAGLIAAVTLALANFPIGAVLSPARLSIVMVALATLFAGVFALQKPAFIDARGLGGLMFGAGGLLGIIGAVLLSRWEKTAALERVMRE